jgi:hypothetical protein
MVLKDTIYSRDLSWASRTPEHSDEQTGAEEFQSDRPGATDQIISFIGLQK